MMLAEFRPARTLAATALAALLVMELPAPLALAQSAPAPAAQCGAAPLGDGGTFTARVAEGRGGGGARRAARKAQAGDAANDSDAAPANRKPRKNAVAAEGQAITEVSISFQCGGSTSDGAYIPTGYRLELTGECAAGTCDLGTTVATEGPDDKSFVASMKDEVGFRQIRLGKNRRDNWTLAVRTRAEGERGGHGANANVRYQLRAD